MFEFFLLGEIFLCFVQKCRDPPLPHQVMNMLVKKTKQLKYLENKFKQ